MVFENKRKKAGKPFGKGTEHPRYNEEIHSEEVEKAEEVLNTSIEDVEENINWDNGHNTGL